ncbi:MAG: MBL fold metallo-hydrolase [Lachnospiraceae bacterium]|nr:MBL fold metallo-hydrolase [Lachnospiraceae bacterium]
MPERFSNEGKPVLRDLDKITEDMMGPGKFKEFSIFIDPQTTPTFLKAGDNRVAPHFPIIYEIADHTYQINEFGMANFYVLVGKERGLVIDCGCGSVDSKAIIEHLCTKPYDVVITHGHGDHCGAMCQFEKVWMFPADFDKVHNNFRVNQQLWENPNIWRSMPAEFPDGERVEYEGVRGGSKDFYDFSNLTFMGIDEDHLPELCALEDGQVFDLGERKVTVLNIPGHTEGSAVFIDPKSRIAFTGDSVNEDFNLDGNTPARNVEILSKLLDYRDYFDRMYPGHTAIGYNTANFSKSPALLEDAIGAYRSIVDGTAVYETRKRRNREVKVAVYGKAGVTVKE